MRTINIAAVIDQHNTWATVAVYFPRSESLQKQSMFWVFQGSGDFARLAICYYLIPEDKAEQEAMVKAVL
jgi:hypothetical protein